MFEKQAPTTDESLAGVEYGMQMPDSHPLQLKFIH